jgi:hypothetical protein
VRAVTPAEAEVMREILRCAAEGGLVTVPAHIGNDLVTQGRVDPKPCVCGRHLAPVLTPAGRIALEQGHARA